MSKSKVAATVTTAVVVGLTLEQAIQAGHRVILDNKATLWPNMSAADMRTPLATALLESFAVELQAGKIPTYTSDAGRIYNPNLDTGTVRGRVINNIGKTFSGAHGIRRCVLEQIPMLDPVADARVPGCKADDPSTYVTLEPKAVGIFQKLKKVGLGKDCQNARLAYVAKWLEANNRKQKSSMTPADTTAGQNAAPEVAVETVTVDVAAEAVAE